MVKKQHYVQNLLTDISKLAVRPELLSETT